MLLLLLPPFCDHNEAVVVDMDSKDDGEMDNEQSKALWWS